MSGALENTSYGVSGESGEPAANPGPSGGTIPGPRVLSDMNVECASTLIEIVPTRGEGDGEGDGVASAVCAPAVRTPKNTLTPRSSAAAIHFVTLMDPVNECVRYDRQHRGNVHAQTPKRNLIPNREPG